jgi:hypothetical protein
MEVVVNWKKLRPSWPVAIAAVATLGATSAIAGVTSTPTTVGERIAPVPSPATVRSTDPAQQTLDVLAQPLTAETQLPAQLQAHLSESTLAGENPSLGRKALTTSFGDTFWVVPAADGKICLFVNGGGGGCSPASQIDSGTFSGLMPCAEGGVVHYGMLPNAATGASLTLSDHSSRALTITNNVWAIQIPADHPQPTALSWTQSSSPHQAPVGAPPPPAPGATTTC